MAEASTSRDPSRSEIISYSTAGRGYALVVVYTNNRDGTAVDLENIRSLCADVLKVPLHVAEDLSRVDLLNTIEEFKSRLVDVSYMLLFILGHGSSGERGDYILAPQKKTEAASLGSVQSLVRGISTMSVDGGHTNLPYPKKVPTQKNKVKARLDAVLSKTSDANQDRLYVREIWSQFMTEISPDLNGKPRLVFIQACRGSDINSVQVDQAQKRAHVQKIVQRDLRLVAKLSDFAVINAAVEGSFAYRTVGEGSFMIKLFCETLKRDPTKSLVEIFHEMVRESHKIRIRPAGHDREALPIPCLSHYTLKDNFSFVAP